MFIRHYICLLGLFSLFALPAGAQSFDFAKEFPYLPMSKWKPGMRFTVSAYDHKPPIRKGITIKNWDAPAEKIRQDNLNLEKSVGKVFTYVGLKPVPDDDRDEAMAVLKSDSKTYTRKLSFSKEWIEQNDFSFLEGMIYLDEVDKVRKILLGKTIYPIVQYGDRAGKERGEEMTWLPKHVPVKVTKVEPGEAGVPVMLEFQYPDGRKLSNIYIFSGTNSSTGEPVEMRRFVKNFSLTDTRLKLKGTKETVWKSIQVGMPLKGMTMQECEMAMGKPDRKSEHVDENRYADWYYKDRKQKSWSLEFKNGVLNKYATYE